MEKPMAELSHTIKTKRNWFMSLFIWFWDCEGEPLNTCLIFWGTLFMIVGWPIRLLLGFLSTIFRRVASVLPDPKPEEPKAKREEEDEGPSRAARFLVKLADLAGAFWFKFQTPITWAFRIFVGCVILAAAAYVIYGLTTVAWSWAILWIVLESLTFIIVGSGAFVGLLVYGERRSRRNKPKRHLIRRIYRAVHDHTCANVIIEP
jgi:hypothetical protein